MPDLTDDEFEELRELITKSRNNPQNYLVYMKRLKELLDKLKEKDEEQQ